jgi:hypothetical protein
MKRLADGLSLLNGLPPFAINVYLMGDVLVAAGTRHAAHRILRQVRGHPTSALELERPFQANQELTLAGHRRRPGLSGPSHK